MVAHNKHDHLEERAHLLLAVMYSFLFGEYNMMNFRIWVLASHIMRVPILTANISTTQG